MRVRSTHKLFWCGAAVFCAAVAPLAASAHTNVYFGLELGGLLTPAPVYAAPPTWYVPAPSYYVAPPGYYAPMPVYRRPPLIYYAPRGRDHDWNRHYWQHDHHWGHDHDWDHHDGRGHDDD